MNLNFTKIKIPPPVRQVGLVLASLFAALLSDSQSIGSWVQPSGGGSDSGAGVQLSFTIGQPLDTTFKSGSYMLSFGFNQPPVNLFVDTVDPYLLCAGSLVRVHFTATQYTGTGNIFTAQLSDSSGSFAGLVINLSADSTKSSGTIIVNLPSTLLSSTHYRIRVVSSYPYYVGGPSPFFTINTLPQAAIYPSDTMLYPGDTVVLVASGGTSYYWPQLNSDSPSVAVVFTGDSMDYFVNVTDNDGCGKDAHSHLRLGPLSATVADSLIIINPTIHDTILSLDSNIIGCHDVLLFTTTVVESGSTDSFDIVQALPLDGYLIPDTSALFVVVKVGDHYDTLPVPTSGTGQITFTWNGYNSNLTWQIPAGYFPSGANFQLIATLYTNCSTFVQNGKITTLLYVPPSTTAQTGPTISNINITMPGITATVLNNGYANPGDTVYEKVLICATSDNAPVYQFNITPDPPLNSLQTLSINNIRDNPDSNITLHAPYTVTGADMDTLLGRPYLIADSPGCLVMNVGPFITPDTCPYQFGEVYNWSIGCNIGAADPNMIESCPADSSIDSINVNDNGNHGPLRVSSQLIEGGNVVSNTGGIRICSEPFAIKYQIFNPDDTSSSQPANSNAKLLHSFIVKLDPNWIDTGALVITFISPAGTVDTLAFTDTAGLLTIQLSGSTLNDSSTCYVELNGLKVDSTGPASCSPPINDTIVGVAAVSFYTNCGTLYADSSEPSTIYRNNLDLQPSSYTLLNNLDPPQVSPGDAPVLYFTWKNLQHGSPWNFSDQGNTDSSFFKCDSIAYAVTLSLPSLITFYGSAPHYLHYTHGDSIEITVQTNGTWQATLPADTLGKLDTIWVQVQLGDSCPPDFPGGFIYPTLTISATCTDSGCSQVYCFETLSNVVFVHCRGICTGTGIGTDTLAITNINAPRVAAAYACDVIDFRVRGTGYTGNFPDSTTDSIFLVLNYPSIHDSTDTVFDVAGASATFSYPGHISDSTSISNPVYNATNSTWTVVVYIKDSLACRAIRADGDTFDIDLQLPVECDLPFYNNQYQGFYTLDAINAYFGFNTNTGDTSYSCDPVAANFWLIAHQYGTAASFLPNRQAGLSYDTGSNPCSQTLIITDSAIYGQTTGPEMPGYNRPLITWPGDGSITVSYPDNMSISGVAYIDSSGALYSPPYDSSVAGVGDTIKHFFGYWNGTQYTWPDSGKTGPEYLRQLIVHFTQRGCGGNSVVVHLPHALQDGKAPGTCSAAICSPIITDTFTVYSLSDSGLVSLSDSLTGVSDTFIQPLLTMNPFTVPFNLINHTSLGPGSVYVHPTFSAATGVIQPGISFSRFPSVPLSFNSYDSLPGEHPDISVALNTCDNQIIKLALGYSCGGGTPDGTDFCDQNNSAFIEVLVEPPVVTLASDASLSSGVNFPDCKGICCGDSLFWHLVIVNEGNPPHIGPAYNPVFSLTPQSPGILNISKINFTYTPVGSHLPFLVSVLPGTGVNVYSDTLALLGFPLPGDGRNNFYLAPGDSVTATVYLYGDGANCSTYANLEADINCANVCGKAISTPGLVNTYTFNFNRCSPDSCPSICQGSDAWSVCNPCDNRPPINISPAIKEPDCLTSDGSITLQVSGGLNNGSLLEFDYAWSAPYDQVDTNSIDGLSPGVYSVIVSQLGCSDTLSFTLDNSNFTVSADVQDADCNNGGGSINIVTIRGGTAPFSHRWNNGDTTAAISNLAAGFYTDTIRASGNTTGCADSSIVTFLINQPVPAFIVALSATNIGCGNNPGAVEVARALNDTGSLSYRWSYQNDSTQLITVNDTGTYRVTVTDIVGCTASASAVVKDTTAATLGNNPFVSAKNICAGEGDTVKIYAQGFTNDTCNVIYTLSGVMDTAYRVYFAAGLGVFAINPRADSAGSTPDTISIRSISLSDNPACSASTNLNAVFTVDSVPPETIIDTLSNLEVCAGQSFVLDCSVNPDDPTRNQLSYLWTESDTSTKLSSQRQTFIAPEAGPVTYTITYTQRTTGCTTSSSLTLKVFGVNGGVYYPGCSAGNNAYTQINITGTAPYSYLWSTGATTSTLINLAPGNYLETVSDANGCQDTVSYVVQTRNTIAIHLVSDTGACGGNGGMLQVVASGGVTGMNKYTYIWNNGDSATLDSAAIDTILNLAPGSYIVTVTQAGNNGDSLPVWSCSDIDTFTVTEGAAHICCFTNPYDSIYYINVNTNTSALSIPAGSEVYIAKGVTLTVNNNFTFQNCEVVLGGGSVIEIDAGDTLSLLGDTLKGCDTLWTGIVVNSTAAIVVDTINGAKSVIEDAIAGILAEGVMGQSLKMLVNNTGFYKNQYGVVFYNYVPISNIDYNVSNCYFGMGTYTNMLPAPAGTHNYNRPVAGIVAQWGGPPFDLPITFDTVSVPNPYLSGLPNTFQYMNTGIYAINSVLNIYTNTFDSIRDYEAVNPYSFYGAAVVGSANFTGISGLNHLTVQTAGSTPDSLSSIHFNNCDYGVKALYYSLTAVNNRMENVINGVYTQNSNAYITVYNNYIHQTNYGVSLLNNSSVTQNVNANTIYVNPPAAILIPAVIGLSYHGILIADTTYLRATLQTYGVEETEVTSSRTNIVGNTIYNGLNCIVLNNTKGTFVENNYMHLNDGVAVLGRRAGLYAANSTGLYVRGNYCDADSNYYGGGPNPLSSLSVYSRYRISGLSFYNSYSGIVCNNQMGGSTAATGIGYGMLFSSYCYHLSMHNNTLNQSYYGMALQSSGIASVLSDQGGPLASQENDFYGDGSGGFLSTYRTGSYINTDSFYVPPKFYYSSGQPLTNPDPGYGSLNGSTNSLATIIGRQTVGSDSFPYFCFNILPIPWAFPFPIHRLGLLDTTVAQNYAKYYMEPGFDTTGPWLASKMLYESLYNDTSILNNDSLMNAFYAKADSSDFGMILLSELQNDLLTDSSTLAGSGGAGGSTYSGALATAISLNNSIPDTIAQAANYKAMSGIYLQTLGAGVDTFTNGQLDTIAALAVLCPYSAGDAVYLARSLYAQYDNTIFFDDLTICTPISGDSDRMLRVSNNTRDTIANPVAQTEFVKVYPNPTRQLINLVFKVKTMGTVEFDIIDPLGESVMSQILSQGQNFAQYSTGDLSSGLYYWRLKDSERIIKTGKIVIIR